MADQATDEDITVYDLAQRIKDGMYVTPAAHKEVAAELLRIQRVLTGYATNKAVDVRRLMDANVIPYAWDLSDV